MIQKSILKIISCLLTSTLLFSASSTPQNNSRKPARNQQFQNRKVKQPKLTVAQIRQKNQQRRAEIQATKIRHPHPDILVKDMTEEQLQDMIPYTISLQDKDSVFKIFHFLLSKSPDQNKLKNYKLQLAEYCFSIKDYEKAAFSFEEFVMLYPGCAEAEYCQYKAIMCWFLQSLDASKDQFYTEKTIHLIDEYLRKASNKKFIQEVTTIRSQCRQKLFEHEMHIFEHYLKRKKHSSAQKRYEYMETNFKDIKNIDAYLAYGKKVQEIVKDPKTCPFLIKFNLADALVDKKVVQASEKKAKTALFFLS